HEVDFVANAPCPRRKCACSGPCVRETIDLCCRIGLGQWSHQPFVILHESPLVSYVLSTSRLKPESRYFVEQSLIDSVVAHLRKVDGWCGREPLQLRLHQIHHRVHAGLTPQARAWEPDADFHLKAIT